MNTRAVLYARVSSDDRGNEGSNLKSQLDMCQEYAERKGYAIIPAQAFTRLLPAFFVYGLPFALKFGR